MSKFTKQAARSNDDSKEMQQNLQITQEYIPKLREDIKLLKEKLVATENELQITQMKVNELTGDAQRARADLENYRKQVEKRIEKAEKDERDKTVARVLPLIDDVGRAIENYPKELLVIGKNYQKMLEKLELKRMAPEPGAEFDPEIHNAISVEEGEGEKEVVAETLQAGYMYEGEMLRPAMVRVKKV